MLGGFALYVLLEVWTLWGLIVVCYFICLYCIVIDLLFLRCVWVCCFILLFAILFDLFYVITLRCVLRVSCGLRLVCLLKVGLF